MPAPSPSLPDIEEETESDTSGTEYDSKSEETVADADDSVGDDDCPQHMTYQIHNCQNVYMAVNAFNAHGVKVKNAGNNTPHVNCMSFAIFFSLSDQKLRIQTIVLQLLRIHQHHR